MTSTSRGLSARLGCALSWKELFHSINYRGSFSCCLS